MPLFPYLLDLSLKNLHISLRRSLLVPQARGRVLEIGIGTGLNLKYYRREGITQVVGLDPDEDLHPLCKQRAAQAPVPVEIYTGSAEEIPFPDHSFDTVLSTLTLCSIPDPVKALKEIRRVLKPEGIFLFCEHGRVPDPRVARWQDVLTPLWKRISGGCHLNRPILELIEGAGFSLHSFRCEYLPYPRIMGFLTRGLASPGSTLSSP